MASWAYKLQLLQERENTTTVLYCRALEASIRLNVKGLTREKNVKG